MIAENNLYDRFRFAEGIKRVTGGAGGEALLVQGSEKSALIDCGMAFCGEKLAANIKNELGEKPLDYVILSHTHYDHIGGLPYLRKNWPDLISFGTEYGKKVLEKSTALNQIRKLSEFAWKLYSEQKTPSVLMDGLSIDRAVCEMDIISLGDRKIQIFETPGHTSCSISLLLEPGKILFASESSGVYTDRGYIITGMLKSCRETVDSIEKCRAINPDAIIAPHFGLVPECDIRAYWDMALDSVKKNSSFILKKIKEGASFDEIMEDYTREFYVDFVTQEQPKKAFLLNAENMIRNFLKEYYEKR